MNRFLVTGGSGYVGQELIHQLLAQDAYVTTVGRKQTEKGTHFIKGDIRDYDDLMSKVRDIEVDYIMHLASLPGDTGNPSEMLQTNVNGCLNVLEIARHKKIKKIIIASSISAYGWYPGAKFIAPEYLPIDEEHPCRPRDMYSLTKRMQEQLAITHAFQYGVQVVCLRLTAVVGPNGQGGGRGWREMAQEFSEGKVVRIPHFCDSEQCHYVDVRDVARMFLHTAVTNTVPGEIFNCCGPNAVSGTEFANIILKHYPDISVEYGFPWSMAQGNKIEFSMQKAKNEMEFEPIYDLDASIANIKTWVNSGGLDKKLNRSDMYSDGINQ